MKVIIFIFIHMLLLGTTSFEKEKVTQVDKDPKIKCRLVCDKKAYKEQKISKAIEFYKNSKYYFKRSK